MAQKMLRTPDLDVCRKRCFCFHCHEEISDLWRLNKLPGKQAIAFRRYYGQHRQTRWYASCIWEDVIQRDAANVLRIRKWEAEARDKEEWRNKFGEAMARKRAESP
jgi:hypothetical protein